MQGFQYVATAGEERKVPTRLIGTIAVGIVALFVLMNLMMRTPPSQDIAAGAGAQDTLTATATEDLHASATTEDPLKKTAERPEERVLRLFIAPVVEE